MRPFPPTDLLFFPPFRSRDEALGKIENLMTAQIEQELSIENEMEGYKKDIVKEQLKNEQLTAMLKKGEGESEHLRSQVRGGERRKLAATSTHAQRPAPACGDG